MHQPHQEHNYAAGKKGKNGIRRIINAAGYSRDGFAAAYRHESAFRQVLWLNAALVVSAFLAGFDTAVRMMLVAASFLSLIVELFNTAIEAAVDHTSTAEHDLAKRAKDAGSAAQLLALVLLAVLWLTALAG